MSSWSQDRAEVERFLNDLDSRQQVRRKDHHAESAYYDANDAVWAVTLCARHHVRPFSIEAIAEPTIGALRFYRDRGLCLVYAYCLMPDHLHAVLRMTGASGDPSDCEVGLRRLIWRYKRYTTTQIAWKQGLHGPLWQRDFFDRSIRTPKELEAQCRYVLENPVRGGLVKDWTDYPWAGMMDEWW